MLRFGASVLLPLLAVALTTGDVRGQVAVDAVLHGRVLVGDAPLNCAMEKGRESNMIMLQAQVALVIVLEV